jgi:MerR family copper efflux transcriptional regulator
MSSNLRLPLATKTRSAPLLPGHVGGHPQAPGSTPDHQDDGGSEVTMQVGDLARVAGKTVRAIHLYEEIGLLRPAARSKGRFRLYGPDALTRIRWIGKMQDLGFSLHDILAVVREWEELGSAPRAMVQMREAYRRKLEETREQIRKLKGLEHEIEASLDYLDTCEVCEPERLLSACSHCDHHANGHEAPELVAGFRVG